MGLEDTVYEEGTVSSRKDLDELTISRQSWEMLIEQQIVENFEPDYLFKGCSDEELKAIIEYIDKELESRSPFGYDSEEITQKARQFRKELLDLLMD